MLVSAYGYIGDCLRNTTIHEKNEMITVGCSFTTYTKLLTKLREAAY